MANPSRQISWPFHFGAHGGVAYVDDPIRSAVERIQQLVLTRIGERVMAPGYGTPTHEYLFEASDPVVAAELGLRIKAAINEWEPDIHIQSVVPTPGAWEQGSLTLDINFVVSPRTELFTTVVQMGGSIGGSEGV